jgi:hypothetical protein
MNKITTALVPTTVGSIALGLMAAHWSSGRDVPTHVALQKPAVEFGGASGTFGEFGNALGRFAVLRAKTASLVSFYSQLMANQEELGREFESVLFDNVWDLYAR